MNKCHTPITWHNDTTPAINETNLNYEDGCIDTIDDRVVAMDTSKANQSDLLKAFRDVSLNTTTGVITFTLFNNTTKTIDTLLEKIAINFDYDDDPTSPHYQNLIIELEDGTYKYIDMSALITQYEFTDSSTIDFTVTSGAVSASVIDGSITGAKLQPNYLADVTAQANTASAAATTAGNKALVSEGWAVGKQNGVDVDSSSPYFHNNAEWYKDQAQQIAGGSIGGLSDVTITSPTDGQILIYNAGDSEWDNADIPIINSNPNLFLNPWFTINQRGASGLIPTQTYGYDKWLSINGSYSVTANGFVYSGSGGVVYIWDSQPISNGETFTYSVRYADDTIASVSGTFTENQSYIADSNEKITISSATQVNLSGFNTNKVVKAVKLEVGNESTLAADHAPDYQTELLKIQKASLAAIAQVEPDDKAISAHSVGSFFVDKNGKMCRVISAISQGATITIGSNCSETDVGKEIEKFALKKLNPNATNNVHSDYNFDAFILLGQYSGSSIYDVVTVAPSATITHFGNATGITVTSVDQNNVKITVPIYYNCRITGNGGNITIS